MRREKLRESAIGWGKKKKVRGKRAGKEEKSRRLRIT